MPQAYSSVTSLVGALRVNYSLGMAAYDDAGGKLAVLISNVTQLAAQLGYVQALLTSANLSAVGFSALSATPFSSAPTVVSNFLST